MQNILLLTGTLIICILTFVLSQYYFIQQRKNRQKEYSGLYDQFIALSCSHNTSDYLKLIDIGTILVYHPCLTGKHLNKMYSICQEREVVYPNLKELRLKMYNKKLYFDRYASAPPF